jgi:hypothetical protein
MQQSPLVTHASRDRSAQAAAHTGGQLWGSWSWMVDMPCVDDACRRSGEDLFLQLLEVLGLPGLGES